MITITARYATFEDVRIGDIFLHNDNNKKFIKIKPIRVSDTKSYNAVALETGKAEELNLCDPVLLCHSTIQIII